MEQPFDAILIVAFGGPEKKEDVMPFLENVVRGRNVPRERLLEVAEHYYYFGGMSPINSQIRELIDALRSELDREKIELPIYWGNRNWHPLLADTMQSMTSDGITRALAFVPAAYSSYSSCRQYREDIAGAQQAVGNDSPRVDKIRAFFNHPDFIAASIDRVREALEQIPVDRRDHLQIAFTAHSIPLSMAEHCEYETQLTETCRLVAEGLCFDPKQWRLVYQSRSGRPQDPWLEPDIRDHLANLKTEGVLDVIIMPIGFVSDHLEVQFDLDVEARQTCEQLGLTLVRASTVGTHPRFVAMLRELIQERLSEAPVQQSIGHFGPSHDVCPEACCPQPIRPGHLPS